MAEDRERLWTLAGILSQGRHPWDLTGDPPEIPDSVLEAEYLRKAIEEIQRDFPETLAAIAAGEVEVPPLPENQADFDALSDTLFQLGVFWDGHTEPPDLDTVEFDPPENREIAEGILAEMVEKYPQTIAQRQEDEYPILRSFFELGVYRDSLPPQRQLKPLRGKH